MMLSQQSYPWVRLLSFLSLYRPSHSTFTAVWAQVILLCHVRAESWMPGPRGRVGAAFGWVYGEGACALTQGNLGRSSFLCRIKLIVLLVLICCCFSQPSVNYKKTGNFLLLEVTLDCGSSIFIHVKVLCPQVQEWTIWCGIRFFQPTSRTLICPCP